MATQLKQRLTALTAAALTAVAALLLPAALTAREASDAFVDAPSTIFPLLDRSTRLDMIDYFNSNMTTPSQNNVGGASRLTELTPLSLRIEMTPSSSYQIALIPARGDTLIAVVTTVLTPAPDSRLDIYTSDWTRQATETYFDKPALDDWLTDQGRKNRAEVETFVPFLLISYDYNPSTSLLTLTNNTRSFLSEDIYEIVGGSLRDKLLYRFDGKRFNPAK
ncbi:MAG: DUF3256 family protein [Clostridium sp.]|nr:DUF3256 family protein [Clostridium sp.]